MQCSSNSNNDGGQQDSQLSLHFSGCGPMGHFWMCGLLVLSKVETWNDNHGRTDYLGVQVAELDMAYSDYSGRLIHTEFCLGETARDLDFLQDYASSIYMGWSRLGVSGGTMNCL